MDGKTDYTSVEDFRPTVEALVSRLPEAKGNEESVTVQIASLIDQSSEKVRRVVLSKIRYFLLELKSLDKEAYPERTVAIRIATVVDAVYDVLERNIVGLIEFQKGAIDEMNERIDVLSVLAVSCALGDFRKILANLSPESEHLKSFVGEAEELIESLGRVLIGHGFSVETVLGTEEDDVIHLFESHIKNLISFTEILKEYFHSRKIVGLESVITMLDRLRECMAVVVYSSMYN